MNIIKSYSKLTKEVKDYLSASYPEGFEGYTKTLTIKEDTYLVIPLKFGSENYMIKLRKLIKDEGKIDFSKIGWEGELPGEEA